MDCLCNSTMILTGIEALLYAKEHLKQISVDADQWEIEYLCPETNQHWTLDYPQSELQGGGPPRLRVIQFEAAQQGQHCRHQHIHSAVKGRS
jgi:hypothetical protein